MNRPELASIIEYLKAQPELKNLYFDSNRDSYDIYGQYKYLGYIWPIDEDKYRYCTLGGVNSNIVSMMDMRDSIIRAMKEDKMPPLKPVPVGEQLYKQMFPTLAEERTWRQVSRELPILLDTDIAQSEHKAHKILRHWENGVIQRKLQAALGGSRLPLPIRDAIID